MQLLAELKRRNVFRVAGLYLVVAWLVAQVCEVVFPAFDVPMWVMRAVLILLAVGFVPALVFAWVFELTPDGLRREYEVPEGESIAPLTAKRMNRAIIVALALALGYFALDKFVLAPRSAADAPVAAALAPGAAALDAPPHNTIAVLPFANMSSDKEQDYFSVGLSEELLNLLTQVPNLRVTARTSSFSFKDKDADIATIAKALNVAHVLEGSVRKSGDRLRVTAQLIRASDSTHLWSGTFDREMADVFAVQDEIARAVALALRRRLAPDQVLVTNLRTDNPDAYIQALKGIELAWEESPGSIRQSIAAFERALVLDPGYAGAHWGLSYAYSLLADHTGEEAYRQRALAEAEDCIALSPGLAGCYLDRAFARLRFQRDWTGAKEDIDKAASLPPDKFLPNLQFLYLAAMGQSTEAIAVLRDAVAKGPDSYYWTSLGRMLNVVGNFDEAREALQQALALNPEWNYTRFHLGANSLLQGRAQEALGIYREMGKGAPALAGIAMAEHALGNAGRSDAALEELVRDYDKTRAYQIAGVHAWRGDADRAFEWLDRAIAQNDAGLVFIQADPFLTGIVDDPRYAEILRKMGLRD